MFSTYKNTPIDINLVDQASTTGWSISGDIATHESCNSGYMYLDSDDDFEVGQEYEVTYNLISNSNGYTRVQLGSTNGVHRTSAGFYSDTLTATGDGILRFFSTADCELKLVAVKKTSVDVSDKKINTIARNELVNKWTSFYTYIPDVAFSMFTNLYSFKNGQLFVHRNQNESRNNFYGTQYKSIIKSHFNQNPQLTKTFQSLYIRSNELMITSEDGVETSLGQVSELVDVDFLKEALDDGISQVDVYSEEGVYKASFLRDKNEDILNGSTLKGNYVTVELVTTNSSALKLFTLKLGAKQSYIG